MTTEKLDLQSPDLVNENFERLAELFPNCVTETATGKAIDFDLLKQELNYAVVDGTKERYRLEWPGKKEAIVTANLPTTKTLRPVREDSVDFNNTQNLYIEGDNLEVLKLLQESYLGKIKMIYIDPPYNTGKDFVYKDNFTQETDLYKEESGQVDEYNLRLVANPETSGRYHSDWLTMIYPRLKLARNLLTDDGVIFMSIGDIEVDNLKKVANEIFGEMNFITILSRVMKKGGQKGVHFSPCVDYILVYAKNVFSLNQFREEISQNLINKVYTKIAVDGKRKGEKYRTQGLYQAMLEKRPNQRFYIECPDGTLVIPPGSTFPETATEGEQITPNDGDGVWRWTYDTYKTEKGKGNVEFVLSERTSLVTNEGKRAKWNVYKRIWLNDRMNDGQLPGNILENFESRHSSAELKLLEIPFDFPKPKHLIKYLMSIIGLKHGDIVLDFFSGSGTTAHASIELSADNQQTIRFICVQLDELTKEDSEEYKAGYKTICDLAKERIRRAAKSIVNELSTRLEQKKEELENSKTAQLSIGSLEEDDIVEIEIEQLQKTLDELDTGFRVYRLDSSNMQDVYYRPQEYKQTNIDMFADNVKPDRTPDDLLAQVMLDWGLSLSLKIEPLTVSDKRVFRVADNSLYACFDKGIDEAFAREVAKDQPLRVVFRDSSFKDDTAKTNVKQLLKQLSPETEMKVI